ncbi:MAG: helix-turn-helix domain-containing protein [Chloroflexi bacterium]|nr:helix-turn-helix domain-containing protein [Chloroflexota bacterium]
MEEELYTIKQAAKYLSISEPVLRLTIRGGKIRTRRLPGRRTPLIKRSELQRYVDPLTERP